LCFPGIIGENDMVATANNLPDWTMKSIMQKQLEMFPLLERYWLKGDQSALFGCAGPFLIDMM
jgi:hypothetical protein